MKLKYMLFAGFITMCYSGIMSADIHWEQTDTSNFSEEITSVRQTIFFSTNKFAIESEECLRMILDLSSESITTINNKEKTFMVLSLEEIEQMKENIQKETEKIMDDVLENMPEDQRELYKQELEEQMKKRQTKMVKDTVPILPWEAYKSTGKTEKILGYTAVQYTAVGEDGTVYELWSTSDVNMSELIDFFNRIGETHFFKDMEHAYNTLKLGFPLKFKKTLEDTEFSSEVISISFDDIPVSVFTVPEGYTKMTIKEEF